MTTPDIAYWTTRDAYALPIEGDINGSPQIAGWTVLQGWPGMPEDGLWRAVSEHFDRHRVHCPITFHPLVMLVGGWQRPARRAHREALRREHRSGST